MTELRIQTEFPDSDRDDWQLLAERGLRGAGFDTLISQTEDATTRGPLFDSGDRPTDHAPLPRSRPPLLKGRPWHICTPVNDADLAFANEQVLADLKDGASAIRITRSGFTRCAEIRRVLESVHLDLIPLIITSDSDAVPLILQMDELTDTPVTLGLDPLGEKPECPETWRAFTFNAAAINEAGGTDVLELAGFAATTAEGFRRHGPIIHAHMSVLLSVGTDAHLNIVKIRAARRIYSSIAGAFGIEDSSLPVHAISSLRMMQNQDAWTNLLRTMNAGFGAVVGGADFLTLRPFTDTPDDRHLGSTAPFSYHIARNQQLLMMEESHLGQVQDPAYGSYFHERLTEDLAQAAWSKFQQIESGGGIQSYLISGSFNADCDSATAERSERKNPILGVTLHPSDDVPAPEVRQ